jgi:hypothetical protein
MALKDRKPTQPLRKIGSNMAFQDRTYKIIAFNAPFDMDPDNADHLSKICEVNDIEPSTLVSAKWAKPIEKRSDNQRTAHLFLTLNKAQTKPSSKMAGKKPQHPQMQQRSTRTATLISPTTVRTIKPLRLTL